MNAQIMDVFTAGVSNGEFALPEKSVVVMERGSGYKLWDTTGKEYLDFSIGWGSCLPGHAHPAIVDVVSRQIGLGSNFSYLSDKVLALAAEIKKLSPAVERIRFCASGTESTFPNPMGTKLHLSVMHDNDALNGFRDRLQDILKSIR